MAKKKPNPVLRRFHARGKCANMRGAAQKAKNKRTWGILECLGAETSTARNRLMEARKFAKHCNDEELNFLCRLGQKEGRPLTRFHVLQLIRVTKLKDRKDLATKCAKKSWSVRRLEMEVRRLVSGHTYGGRKHEPPKSHDEELLVTDRLLSSVIRWDSVVGRSRAKKPKRAKRTKRRPTPPPTLPEIGAWLHEIAEEAYDLCVVIRNKLEARRLRSRKDSGRRN